MKAGEGEERENDKVHGRRQRKTNKRANNLQPAWHVDNMYAATIHAFCPRELNDWEGGRPPDPLRAKRMLCGNDDTRTHSQVESRVELQSGAEGPATAKPEKNKDISCRAKSDILSVVG